VNASPVQLPRVETFSLDLARAMQKRRMHRAFQQQPLSEEMLAKLLWAASRAPTARPGIRQFLVTSRPDLVRLVRQVCPGFLNDAPTIVAIVSDLERASELVGSRGCEVIARIDAGAAAGYMALAAPALELGMCLTTSWTESAVQEIFDLPAHVRPEVLVGVGYVAPAASPTVKATPPAIFDSSYGTPWHHGD
jgi:nitroreductase